MTTYCMTAYNMTTYCITTYDKATCNILTELGKGIMQQTSHRYYTVNIYL